MALRSIALVEVAKALVALMAVYLTYGLIARRAEA